MAKAVRPRLIVLAEFSASYVETTTLPANYDRHSGAEFAQGIRRTVEAFSNANIPVAVLKGRSIHEAEHTGMLV
ncbi:hypothetical protein CO650_05970 [Rhizobium phaseoli]|nr:hypothetical protein CO650_05970 [Rhizobium phaseoli]